MKNKRLSIIEKKTTITKYIFLSVITIFTCMGIPYINSKYGMVTDILFLMRMGLSLLFFIELIKRGKLSNVFFIVIIVFGDIFLVSLIRKRNLVNLIIELSKPICMCLFCEKYFSNKMKTVNIIKTWQNILLFLVTIDLFTMLVFRNGMNINSYYAQWTWFLGYKSARIPFEVLLICLCVLNDTLNKRKYSFATVYALIVTIICSFLSKSTGCFLIMLLYGALIIFSYIRIHIKNNINFKVFSFGKVISLYVVLFASIVIGNLSPSIQRILTNYFHKSADLSFRTYIWKDCIEKIMNAPICGNGMYSVKEYVMFTNYTLGTNAHNFVLTLMITGGIVLLVLYFIMIKIVFKNGYCVNNFIGTVCMESIVIILLHGLTSSVLVWSPLIIILLYLSEFNKMIYSNDEMYLKKVRIKIR